MQEITVCSREPVLEFSLSGEIDSENSEDFYAEVMELYAPAPRDIVFSCAKLDFIDSTTLGTFVKILKRVRADGHNMKLVSLQPRLKKLFTICALDKIMEISE